MTLAKGSEHVVNQNSAALGGAITNAWVLHAHYESQTTATGIVPTVILANLATAHRSATTITSLRGVSLAQSVIGASSIITTLEDIYITLGTMTGTIPTHRGMRVTNIGSAQTATSEAIRIDAQSGSTGNSYSLNILGGQISIINTGAAGLLSSTSQALTISTTTSGTLLVSSAGALNHSSAAASTYTIAPAVASSWGMTDGTTVVYRTDTRITTDGVIVHQFDATGPTIASVAGSLYHLMSLDSYTVTLTGGTGVTSMDSLTLRVLGATLTSATPTTVAQASSLYVRTPVAAGSVTLTLPIALQVDGNVQLNTNVANAAIATAMSSVGPTGSHTAIQEWFVFYNASGVARYVPAW
jgi:hypothetical protein